MTQTTNTPEIARIPYDQPWLTSLLRPLLIALMVVCIDLVLLTFIARLAPWLAGRYVPVILGLSVLAVVVGCVTTTWLIQPTQRQRRNSNYRLAEVALLLVLTRLAIWLATGAWPGLAGLLLHPLDALFDGLFITGGLIVAFSWSIAATTTDDLLGLALQPDELYALKIDRLGEMVRTSHTDRPALLNKVVARWVGGGIVLVLLAASVRLGPSSNGIFALTRQNIQPSVIGAIVVYFLAGLVLISQGQLALLRSRWIIDRVPSADNVLRNWPVYVLLLLVLIGAVAMLLPFGGTFYLAQILAATISFFFNSLFAIFRFLMSLLFLLIALITGDAPPEQPPPPPPPAAPPPPIEALPQTNLLPEWTGGALFWVTMALLLGYAAYIYFSGKGVQFIWLLRFWHLLRARWLQLFGAYQQWQISRIMAGQRGGGTATQKEENFASWGRLRNLDPSGRVRYFYLSLLYYARQQGMGRADGETPLHYAPRLARQISAAQAPPVEHGSEGIVDVEQARAEEQTEAAQTLQDVYTLTEAFLAVRYARQPVNTSQLPVLERIWHAIQRQLRV
ncbi:MAG: hypothetical protein M3Q45_15660 [Chloroflexota bacterium]|nr:hypothetical protein [Chloroflexota bacterium]